MRCGNCKADHESVAKVRECFEAGEIEMHPTPKMVSLAQALGRERVRLPEHVEMEQTEYELHIGGMTWRSTSDFIGRMLKQPGNGMSKSELFERVLNGRYALENEVAEVVDIRFYLVDGDRSRSLRELTGAPGDFREQRIYRPEKILKRIGDDPLAAMALYGLNVGRCGRCGSPLTKKHTRERGIGDTCYAKMTGGTA